MTTNRKGCFFCGRYPTSREHIPPKQLFKGFRSDSITVPSCKLHNEEKSSIDQIVTDTLVIPLFNQAVKEVSPNISKAIAYRKSSFPRTRKFAYSATVINHTLYNHLPEVSYISSTKFIVDWIRMISAGLYYDCLGYYDPLIDWANSPVISPSLISKDPNPYTDPNELIEVIKSLREAENLASRETWFEGWSAYPKQYPKDIFSFEVAILNLNLIFRLRFYNQYNFYCLGKLTSTRILDFIRCYQKKVVRHFRLNFSMAQSTNK